MKLAPALLALVLLAGPAPAQEKPPGPWEVILKHEKALKAIPGVIETTTGAVNGEKRIVVRVEDERARDAVRALLGERSEGFPVHIIVSRPSPPEAGACTHGPLHCKGPGQTVAAPGTPKFDATRIDDPAYAQERCDIIRKWMGLPRLKDDPACIEMVSGSNDSAKLKWVIEQGFPHWKSKEMPGLKGSDTDALACREHGSHSIGEIVCYTWIKHKQFCPLGMKQVLREIREMTPARGSRP
jgi:hypothetical protein